MIRREIEAEILEMAQSYPVVTMTGPRQSGKTTVLRMLFPDKPYVNMEDPDVLLLATSDPRRFLEKYPDGAIIDEIQRAPHIPSYLQGIVDEKPNAKGLFFLTGRQNFAITQSVSQSLAGRTAMLKLLPLSIKELAHPEFSANDYLFHGMYPRIYKDNINSTKFYRDYIMNYLERDVRQITTIQNLSLFQKFLRLCAGRIGQLLNKQSLANDVGVSHTTISNWLSILEASFIIVRLQPYFENVGKRLIKMPKIYFTDVGLARYLLDILSIEQLDRDPLRGSLFENFVIIESIKHQLNLGIESSFYFYRDSQQTEIDLLYRKGADLITVEIKSAQTFDLSFLKGLKKFNALSPHKIIKGFVIYAGHHEQHIDQYELLNFKNLNKIFQP